MGSYRLEPIRRICHKSGFIEKIWDGSQSPCDTSPVKEIYFATNNFKEFKGWKNHSRMTCRLFVVSGTYRFFFNKDMNETISLSRDDQKILIIPPGTWYGFFSETKPNATVMNFADVLHSDEEVQLDDV